MKYHEYMDEIESDTLLEGLLGYGLFSSKIPPFLSSKDFYAYSILNSTNYSKKEKEFVYFESLRNTNVPRPLGIPNPFAYYNLCNCLSENWEELKIHFKKYTENHNHKISRIHLRKMKDKDHLFEMNYSNFRNDSNPEPDLLIGKRYIVKADISNCFPSIYTHAIPWALMGKNIAKCNKNSKNCWRSELDKFTRNIKDAETHGLLIGPHTSNLIAEILLVVIDDNLFKKGYQFIRNIDDYTCYVENSEMADRFLLDLSEQLRDFDFTLNHKKTEILELPKAAASTWIRKLKAFQLFNNFNKVKFPEVQSYLDLVLELMDKNKNDAAILKYAIKTLASLELTMNAQEYYFKVIQQLVVFYPYLISLLDQYVFQVFEIGIANIEVISNSILNLGLKTNNYEAISYACFYALKYDFKLEEIPFLPIEKSDNSIVLLLCYLYSKEYGTKEELKQYIDYAKKYAKKNKDISKNWLFIYEVLPMSLLKDEWKNLKKEKVSFVEVDSFQFVKV
ncbi:hypothetical protein Awo_c08820 [Acetobacterium woodii DSM 1030]|uniref:Reverse transcriptase domain-containing protein n=2 Tax=Acetobacterium woodii TaxID=33952 RepID=H6LBT0_ACEWD|nr:hypothetical protein Awo_c08820 [Acetobacterium woodii DSM 1030]